MGSVTSMRSDKEADQKGTALNWSGGDRSCMEDNGESQGDVELNPRRQGPERLMAAAEGHVPGSNVQARSTIRFKTRYQLRGCGGRLHCPQNVKQK